MRRGRAVLGLLVVAGVGAELLAAYSDNTGDPALIAFALLFFAGLYGAPALLIRELARRQGWGWPSMLLLAAAAGLLQAGVIDQSLFSAEFGVIEDWEQTFRPTLIGPLGVSAFNAHNFLVGHIVYSYGAAIAVAEAWRPADARSPWLRRRGIIASIAGFLLTAGLVAVDPESHDGSSVQVGAAVALVVACVAAACAVGDRSTPVSIPLPPPTKRTIVAVSLGTAAMIALLPPTWAGTVAALALTALGGWLLRRASRRIGWSVGHASAVAIGCLLARGLLAFLYFPLAGEVDALPKYLHNVMMLAVVVTAAVFALGRAGGRNEPSRNAGR